MNLETWKGKLLAGLKFVLSYRKRDWTIEDYPVVVRKQAEATEHWGNEVRFKTPAYIAHVVRWPGMDGTGDTPAEAKQDLREAFERICAHRGDKPRPGTYVQIQFASQTQIDRQQEFAEEFVHSVLDLEWALLTDESSLWHFTMASTLDEFYTRIDEVYGVDVRDVPDGNIAQILEKISAARQQTMYALRLGEPFLLPRSLAPCFTPVSRRRRPSAAGRCGPARGTRIP